MYSFRKELLEKLLDENNQVYISVPSGEKVDLLEEMGCKFIDTFIDRRGKNIFKDYKLFLKYKKMIKKISPEIVLTYTIKPNIYGGIACKSSNISYIANITGLGTAVGNGGILSKILLVMYKIAFKNVTCVFCQNQQNYDFMKENKIVEEKLKLIPGSGVNLKRFKIKPYPKEENYFKFLFMGRVMREKGIEEYLEVAKTIRKKYHNTEFGIVGSCEEEKYLKELETLNENNVVKYYGRQKDVKPFLENACCIIHPTFYPEGMSNVLLEASATGRPVITTNRPGCKEIVNDGETGFLVEERNIEQLIETVEKFINLSYEKRKELGINARKKVEKEFDRNIVIDAYISEIYRLYKNDNS